VSARKYSYLKIRIITYLFKLLKFFLRHNGVYNLVSLCIGVQKDKNKKKLTLLAVIKYSLLKLNKFIYLNFKDRNSFLYHNFYFFTRSGHILQL